MNCPKCGSDNNKVIDSRERYGGMTVRRRRECKQAGCRHRWTSMEAPDELFAQLVDIASTYYGIQDAIASTSSDDAALIRQFFNLSHR